MERLVLIIKGGQILNAHCVVGRVGNVFRSDWLIDYIHPSARPWWLSDRFNIESLSVE